MPDLIRHPSSQGRRMKGGWVYIITNKPNGTLYVGVTSDIKARIHQHREGKLPGFTKTYDLKRLVFTERHEEIEAAIAKKTAVKKEEVVAEEVFAEAPAKKAPSKKVAKADDLTIVEGIGPKIAEILVNNGIVTFADLAKTEVSKIEELLAEAGSNYNTAVPTTWPEQAQLAADGKFEALEALKVALDAGKKVD